MLIRHSVKEQIYEIIKERILQGEYAPGDVVNIAQLSVELEASNTPIREALSRLESDGLIVKSGSRHSVVMINDKMNEDMDQAFSVLLTAGLDLCVKAGKLDELANDLRCAFDEQKKAFGGKDFNDYLRKTIEFDFSCVKVSGNALLMSMLEWAALFLMFSISTKHKGNFEYSMQEHEEILSAVESRDSDMARELIIAHFNKPLSKYPV